MLNYAGVSVLTPAEMSTTARRVLRFIDLGGHEKYLKTALYGMTCMVSSFYSLMTPVSVRTTITMADFWALSIQLYLSVVNSIAVLLPPALCCVGRSRLSCYALLKLCRLSSVWLVCLGCSVSQLPFTCLLSLMHCTHAMQFTMMCMLLCVKQWLRH